MKKTISLKLFTLILLSILVITGFIFMPIIIKYENEITQLENSLAKKQISIIDQDTKRLENEEFEKFNEVYDILYNKYREKMTTQELLDGAILGMIEALDDPYTNYMNAEEASNFAEQMEGEYQGIGAGLYEENGQVIIEYTFKDSPAEKAGVLPGDVIAEVNGQDVRGWSSSEIVTIVRGDKGTKVKIGFERPGVGEVVNITITRDTIPLISVEYKIYKENNKKIGYIEMTRVGEKTFNEMQTALEELGEIDSLIVDVRNNPGGYLHIIKEITNLFVGDTLPFIQVEDRNGNVEKYFVSSDKVDYQVVVLINEHSASAAEIFAAALSQIEDFELVGKTTYGKGTVQTQNLFNDGSNLKYTIQKFLAPNGEWFHGKGVNPTIEVDQPEFYSYYRVSIEDEITENIYSDQILNAEKILDILGYEIIVDGFLDNQTMNELGRFQKTEGLKVTNNLTVETANTLNREAKEMIEDDSNDLQLQKALELLR